ncbi:hypothetical protein AB0G81_06015 [Streptomyces asoensis]|uniref:hypothetical protein n=1 Tax=Streptomyces asoensis TaxID=249586 RepID=UPI0033E76056
MSFLSKIVRLLSLREAQAETPAMSSGLTFQSGQFVIRISSSEFSFPTLHQALSETPLGQDITAARRIHRFITRSDPSPTIGDLWSALFSEGLTERIPLSPDLTDPALITVAIFQHLEMRIEDDPKLQAEVQQMHADVVAALRPDIARAASSTSRRRLKDQPLGPEEVEDVAPAAEETIDHTLARLFLRLGPPPEASELDYTPAGRGGGGAHQ